MVVLRTSQQTAASSGDDALSPSLQGKKEEHPALSVPLISEGPGFDTARHALRRKAMDLTAKPAANSKGTI